MPVILPNGVPQLMLLCEAIALVASVRQILFPELGIAAGIYLAVNILGLQHKYSITGDDDMVHLCRVVSITNQEVVVNPVFFAI